MMRIRTERSLPRNHDRRRNTVASGNTLSSLTSFSSLMSFSSLQSLVLCFVVSQSLHAEPPALANIELLVVDADEKPIANAVATLHHLGSGKSTNSVGTGTTDAEGRTRLNSVPPGIFSKLLVKTAEYASSTQGVELVPGETRKLTHHLHTAVDAQVRFEDENAKPISGVEICGVGFKQATGENIYAKFGEEPLVGWKLGPSDSNGIIQFKDLPRHSKHRSIKQG